MSIDSVSTLLFEHAFTTHQAAIESYFKYRTRGLYADLSAETFTRAWAKRNTYTDHGQMLNWLFRIAHAVLVDHWRSVNTLRRGGDLLYFGYLLEPSCEWASREFTEHEDAEWLTHTLACLTERQRYVFSMNLDGYSCPEIADLMGATTNSTRQVLRRAQGSMRRYFNR